MKKQDDYVISLWLWNKSGNIEERHTVFVGHKVEADDMVAYCKAVANELWVEYPSKLFNKEVTIKKNRKVLITKDNFRE